MPERTGTAPAWLLWSLRIALGATLWVAGNAAYAGQNSVAIVAAVVAVALAGGLWRASRAAA